MTEIHPKAFHDEGEGDSSPNEETSRPASHSEQVPNDRGGTTLRVGKVSSYCTALLLVAYAITTALGFASLESPDDPIEDPYFTAMEVLILLTMPPMVLSVGALHSLNDGDGDGDGDGTGLLTLAALTSVAICAGITSCVHFVVLTVSREIAGTGDVPGSEYLFSFEWPSVAYALDILAWDWFFGLSMVSASFAVGGDDDGEATLAAAEAEAASWRRRSERSWC